MWQVAVVSLRWHCRRDSVIALGMRRRDWLGFGRTLLSEEDCEYDHRGDRQELALPVLERLEPKLRRAKILPGSNPGQTLSHLLLAVSLGAPGHMDGEAAQ